MKLACLAMALLPLLALSVGCAEISPYKSPAKGLSIGQRKEIYEAQAVSFNWWNGYRVGGQAPGLTGPAGMERYYRDSGDPGAATLAGEGEPYRWLGLAAGLGGLVAAEALSKNGDIVSSAAPLAALGAGLGLEILSVTWGNERYAIPAAKSFNAFLKTDLELGDADVKGLGPEPGTQPAGPPSSALYGYIDAGFTSISNYDLADYFEIPGASNATNAWPSSQYIDEEIGLGLGYMFKNRFTSELRFDYLDRGVPGRYGTGSNGAQIPDEVAHIVGFDLWLVPGYTFKPFNNPLEIFVGAQLGGGFLMAKGFREDSSGNVLGNYYLREPDFSGGPCVRFQFPTGRWGGVGMDCGYRWEKFSDIPVSNSDGIYAGRTSPDPTLRGSDAFLDFSGPYLNLYLLFGQLPR
jgi:hypothetical protein